MRSCSSFNVFAQQKNKQFASRDALFLRNEEEKTSGLLSHCVFFRKSKRQNAAHGKCFLNKPFFVLLARWKKLLPFLWSVARQRKLNCGCENEMNLLSVEEFPLKSFYFLLSEYKKRTHSINQYQLSIINDPKTITIHYQLL